MDVRVVVGTGAPTPDTTVGSELQAVVDGLLKGQPGLHVLDAGCGSKSHIRLPEDSTVTGLDISPETVCRNRSIKNIIHGDVQTYVFPKASFDAIVCWEVLEHVDDPLRAIDHFCNAVKENGIVILALPNVVSLKGLVTKFTPHSFHVWFLRRWLKDPNAGKPGFAPFPTPIKWSLAPRSLFHHCRRRGVEPIYFRAYVGSRIVALKRRFWFGYCAYAAMVGVLNILSLGRKNFGLSDIHVVLQRRS